MYAFLAATSFALICESSINVSSPSREDDTFEGTGGRAAKISPVKLDTPCSVTVNNLLSGYAFRNVLLVKGTPLNLALSKQSHHALRPTLKGSSRCSPAGSANGRSYYDDNGR